MKKRKLLRTEGLANGDRRSLASERNRVKGLLTWTKNAIGTVYSEGVLYQHEINKLVEVQMNIISLLQGWQRSIPKS